MPTVLTKFTPYRRPDGKTIIYMPSITFWQDVYSGYQEPLVITTPNMDWVPELHNDDLEELRARADGHFGAADCFQWPQMYCKEFKYTVCIPRKDASSIDLQFTWFTPTTANFAIQPGTAFTVGSLHSHIVNGIDNLLTIARKQVQPWQARRTSSLTCSHPSSMTSMCSGDIIIFVAQAQHSFLNIMAFMDFVEIVQPCLTSGWSSWGPLDGNPRWMGCFTTDSKTCDIFLNAGMPVWLVRAEAYISPQMNIIKPVVLIFPDDLTRNVYCEGNIARPFPLLYCGPGGFNRHFHTRWAYTGTFSVNPGAPLPLTLLQTPASGKAPSQGQKNKKARNITSSQLIKPSACISIVIDTRTSLFLFL